jgi:drug/metabolite transporter (DMT)-like permease
MPARHPPVHPLLAVAFGILAVSTGSILVRYAQNYAPSLSIAAGRLLISALILAPVTVFRRRGELAALKKDRLRLALLSGFFLAVHFATWISSLEFTTVVSSVVLVSTVPLWVALLSPFTIKEPVTRLVWMGMLLALVGGIVVAVSDTCAWSDGRLACPPIEEFVRGRAFLGDMLALSGALAGAGYLLIGRQLRVEISMLSYIFIVYSMAAIVLVILAFFAGQTSVVYPIEAFFLVFLLALVPQLLGHSTFNWALGYLSAATVSIALLGEPIGSTILAYVFLNEVPTPLKLFGAILILLGIYIASRSENLSNEPA